ncbi:hypothetical protein BCR35DRAFT_330366 [Leucosporidium creatinivorum]|uniref:Rab-GAP TBC domain-containing protein n=1 Tax=Leucosporidium creatinivorum TaxID=106004 RepID=A0A1Y2FVX2_9BASI|nr:hypothetical protein BCR35DRAFT_330366 [Leucosporidium creatinivorum]
MSVTVDEFADTLNAEQYVDIQKLRSFARYGIPPSLRGEVWLYLLGVLSPDRTNEITSVRSNAPATTPVVSSLTPGVVDNYQQEERTAQELRGK